MDWSQANDVRAACIAELRLTSGVRIRLRQHLSNPEIKRASGRRS